MRRNCFFTGRTIFLIALIGVFAALSGGATAAATVAEYRENVAHLKSDLDSMLAPGAEADAAENSRFEKEVLAEFSKLLPAKDRVDWENTTVEINNQWIYDALRRYEKEPLDSPARARILTEIRERLAAIETNLSALETGAAAASRTKDEDKRRLAEILRRAEYSKPEEKRESLIENLLTRALDWLAEIFPRPNFAPNFGGFGAASFWLQMLLYAALLGAVGYVVYRFAPFFLNRYRAKTSRDSAERVVLGERLAANETPATIFEEAEALARTGDLRAAIRKGYVALLCELSDRKILSLARHKTNRDYLRDVRKRDDLHENVRRLTDDYERHWYGAETAAAADWEAFKNGYRKTFNI